jgi:hypothetical protein
LAATILLQIIAARRHLGIRFSNNWYDLSRLPSSGVGGRIITVRVPISIRRPGGGKLVLAPNGTNVAMGPVHLHLDNAIV